MKILSAGALVATVLAACAAPAAPATSSGSSSGSTASSAPAATTSDEALTLHEVLGAQIPAPDIWNPYIPGTFILQGMNQVMMEPLFMLNYETGKIDGWLAESYSSNDKLDEWTVKLRQGTEWSDGQPLTADDVVFTIQMLQKNAPNLNWSGAVAQWVKSVEAVDQQTIKFTLTGPNPRFVMENLAGTTSQAIVPLPKHVWDGQDPVTFRNSYDKAKGWPVFSGPFMVDHFSSTEFAYKRNDNWWGAKSGAFSLPVPKEVVYTWVPSADTQNNMLVNNQLDIGGPATLSQMQAVMAQNPKLVPYNTKPPYAWRDPCPRMFTVNTTVAPWDNKEMRWALSYAIDREKMNQVVYEGTGAPAGFIFPDYPAMQPYIAAIKDMITPVMQFDQAKSKQLIESQGYKLDSGSGKYVGPDGKNLSIDVVAPPFMQTPATFVVQNLNDVGVDAVLRIIEWGIFREQTGQGHFEGSTDWDGCGSVIEPWFGMNRYNKSWVQPIGKSGTEYVDNTNNAGRWSNDEYSKLVDQMGQLPIGDPKVIPLMQQAVKIWTDELPDIPLVQQPALQLFNTSKFTNWPTADNNYIQPPSHWEHFLRQLVTIKAAQ